MSVIRNVMSKENREIMAIIYYVKDGPLPGTTPTDGRDIMLNEVEAIVLKKDMRCEYCGTTPPEFNRDQPSLYPERVVIEVEEQDRPGNLFKKTGFYFFPSLTTIQAESVFANVVGKYRFR